MKFAPDLTIKDSTRRQLEAFLENPRHALILHGNEGVGITTIAAELARVLSPDQPHILISPVESKSITIDQVRSLYSATQSVETHHKVVLVDDAHTLGFDAQNAFLKLLEEPPANVYFLLVVHDLGSLLPTIMSRAQMIEIGNVTDHQTADYLQSLHLEPTMLAQLQFLAKGLPAKAKSLSDDTDKFEEMTAVTRDARDFLQGDRYNKLVVSNKYSASRESALNFVTTLGLLLLHMSRKQTEQSLKLDITSEVIDRLQENANVKLQLTRLSLTL